ncbi:MAG: Fic family protein [Cyclobacteriaceae bacterium]
MLQDHIARYKSLNLGDVVDYDKFNLFAITAHSTQIEGATLTQEETALLIDEGITPKGKPLEHSLMVKDHHEALRFGLELGDSDRLISTEMIQALNALVMKSTGQVYRTALGDVDASKGELRKGQVYVEARYFPGYDKVPRLLKELCNSINDQIAAIKNDEEKLRLSFSTHFNFMSIHPFYDGNGRTARLLMNLLQQRFELPLSVVYKEDKLDYYQALEESRDEDSLQPFYNFMEAQYVRYLKAEINRYENQLKGGGMNLLF